MVWKGESKRHSLASKGVKTKTLAQLKKQPDLEWYTGEYAENLFGNEDIVFFITTKKGVKTPPGYVRLTGEWAEEAESITGEDDIEAVFIKKKDWE